MSPRTVPVIQTEGLVDRERLKEALVLMRDSLPEGIARRELAGRLGPKGVSLRSVDRILALLEAQGAKIERVRSGEPPLLHFRLQKGPSWDEHVSPEARLALRLASLSLTQAAASFLEDKLGTIEAMVTQHMTSRDRGLFETLTKAVQVRGGVEDPVEPGEVLEPILRALETGRELEVRYKAAGRAEGEIRTVVPHCITLDIFSGGSFLAVWDPKDHKPKHLRLCRIQEAKVGKRPGAITDPEAMANAAAYQIGGWTCGDEPFEVKARIRGTHWIEAFREAPPALPDFEAREAEGVVEVSFKANHLNGASRWLMQFGALAEVMEPARLREHMRKQHVEAAAQYA